MRLKITIIVCLFTISAFLPCAIAVTYHVAKSGNNDTGNGSVGTPWLTIEKCTQEMTGGDICIVHAGVYEESVKPADNGTDDAHTIYMAGYGEQVTVRQFEVNGDSFITISGFIVTHDSLDYNRGILVLDSRHIHIMNNTIHHTRGQGIYSSSSYPMYHCIVRNNTLYYTGCPDVEGQCVGSSGIDVVGNYNLIEYNLLSHLGDFVNTVGAYNVVRNNYGHDFYNADFPDGAGDGLHADFWQGGASVAFPTVYNVFEANYVLDNNESNSHTFQWRDVNGAGDKMAIVRYNVASRTGSYACQFGAVDNVYLYNNTFTKHGLKSPGAAIGFNDEEGDNSTRSSVYNNILYDNNVGVSDKALSIDQGVTVTSHNCCYSSGTDSGCSVTDDPKITETFLLESDSPARTAGSVLTLINAENGSGTQFTVDDSGFFTDGNGIISGDKIKIGSGDAVTVTRINHDNNTITVSGATSWEDDDPVFLAFQSATPDIGAYPYRASGYSLSGTYSKSGGTVTITPSDADLVRFVEVWENGVLVGSDSTSPFAVSGVGSGILSVKMYSLFASNTPVVLATDATPGQVTGSFGGNLH